MEHWLWQLKLPTSCYMTCTWINPMNQILLWGRPFLLNFLLSKTEGKVRKETMKAAFSQIERLLVFANRNWCRQCQTDISCEISRFMHSCLQISHFSSCHLLHYRSYGFFLCKGCKSDCNRFRSEVGKLICFDVFLVITYRTDCFCNLFLTRLAWSFAICPKLP